jgi:hypothetical protein
MVLGRKSRFAVIKAWPVTVVSQLVKYTVSTFRNLIKMSGAGPTVLILQLLSCPLLVLETTWDWLLLLVPPKFQTVLRGDLTSHRMMWLCLVNNWNNHILWYGTMLYSSRKTFSKMLIIPKAILTDFLISGFSHFRVLIKTQMVSS